jgi:CBS domain-containing protein
LGKVRKDQDTYIIANADAASKKVNETLNSAEKEIIVLASSKDVIRTGKNKALLKNWQEKSVHVKIMAPITSENLEAAREISKYFAIKHIAACHSRITIVDGNHLFQFKTPLPDQDKLEGIEHFESTIYTNELEYVQRTKDVLNGIWKDAFDLSRVIAGSMARMPVPTVTLSTPVFDIASIMAKRNIGAVIVVRDFEPLGIVTERDIIEKVLLEKKDSREIVAQEIMTAPIITIHCDRTVEEALEIMQRNHVRRLVVVKGESMVGLLTERRLLLAQATLGTLNKGSNPRSPTPL